MAAGAAGLPAAKCQLDALTQKSQNQAPIALIACYARINYRCMAIIILSL